MIDPFHHLAATVGVHLTALVRREASHRFAELAAQLYPLFLCQATAGFT
jgi:hypothetical protein